MTTHLCICDEPIEKDQLALLTVCGLQFVVDQVAPAFSMFIYCGAGDSFRDVICSAPELCPQCAAQSVNTFGHYVYGVTEAKKQIQ